MEEVRSFKNEDLLALIHKVVDNKGDGVHWTIKVFGSALISVLALILIGTFQQAFSDIHELQSEFRKATASTVQREEFNTKTSTLWSSVREFQSEKASISALQERIKILEAWSAKAEKENKECLTEIQKLKEKIAVLEKK